MISLFTAFVARGAEVPVIDNRLKAHVNYLEVAVLPYDRPAELPAESSTTSAPLVNSTAQ
jgi:hypothetical protein